MIDDFGILFSSGLILLVVVRAWYLDRRLPWFQKVRSKTDTAATKGRDRRIRP